MCEISQTATESSISGAYIYQMMYRPEIRFADIDSYGIVHNAKYLLFFEQSRIKLFHTIAGNWDWEKRGVLVASQKVEYRHPVKINDVLEINTWVKSVGEKSLTIAYEAFIVEGDSSILSAESETVIVCFDPVSKKTVKVPNLWRSTIEDHNLLAKS